MSWICQCILYGYFHIRNTQLSFDSTVLQFDHGMNNRLRMYNYLDFEQPIAELEGKIEELRHLSSSDEVNIATEVSKLQDEVDKILQQTYSNLTPWQKTQVARHHARPHAIDYVEAWISDFTPLAGDRTFANDHAIIGGLGRFRGCSVVIIGTEKGANTEARVHHNFGMAKPEGYRKAARLMSLANQFDLPVITLIDTPGAYPGVDAEARGQAEAIARSIKACLDLNGPLFSVVIGEGGSGGAIALAAGNSVQMLEHAIYSVISPEGCASILWRDAALAHQAAAALKLTAQDLLKLGVIDNIVNEPLGGAHRGRERVISETADAVALALRELIELDGNVLKAKRRAKFLAMGKNGIS